ncbi:aspartyl/asparaginyl beta-hydroxylase domain-containing protein [Neolewinella aurantiaca]|uniref:Aspartyl/asparaginyl beta-hydroxylase domain-containing protein n=1 Tax=Neolewinella aurantiaca TaxID=2602767 RepID=A0A5C7FKF9_9BACT|nr:aspartyl/asparaginyl beta-hydroxylase domain-containing protein [Neolewinella aurantiaca]TXF91163.1 aspartyl/asparaginyl beta-hydroxylase domain-containing protein [Neolewinella aurantiaca]
MDRYKFDFQFDAKQMQREVAELEATSADWINHFVTSNYEGKWSVIPLRANRGAEHPVKMIYSDPTSDDYVDTPFLAQSPYLEQVHAHFKTRLFSSRLMRLGRGSEIKEHRDYGLDADSGTARIHIPVTTNPGVRFLLNGSRVVMEEGSCWYLRLSDPHAVTNDGPDRVHLVIDMEVNDWVARHMKS